MAAPASRLWEIHTAYCKRVFQGHRAAVVAVADMGNGTIASGSHDNTVRGLNTPRPPLRSCRKSLSAQLLKSALHAQHPAGEAVGSRQRQLRADDGRAHCSRHRRGCSCGRQNSIGIDGWGYPVRDTVNALHPPTRHALHEIIFT